MEDNKNNVLVDKKPLAEDKVTIKVKGPDDHELQFKLKASTPLMKLKKSYEQQKNITSAQLRYLYDGKEVNDQDTPESLGMSEGDVIDVFSTQVGGCF